MTSSSKPALKNQGIIERKSLVLSKWANLFMGLCGILAAWLSNSEAVMLDGLFSGVGFAAAIFAVRIGKNTNLPPDRVRPFGYDADEALYTMFRSLSILGLIAFAGFAALMRIVQYAINGTAPELVFGPIVIYFLVICATCLALAIVHRVNWRKTGRQSEMLKLESSAAIVDGVITAAAGAGLIGIPLLAGTPLGFLVPIADSLVILMMCAMIVSHPVFSFRRGLAELAGVSASANTVRAIWRIARKEARAFDLKIIDLSVVKIGRNYTAAIYVDPVDTVSAEHVDQLAQTVEKLGTEAIGTTRAYVIVSKYGRAWGETPKAAPFTESPA